MNKPISCPPDTDRLLLIQQARAGSADAISSLLRHTRPDLRRLASRRCASRADAEDAVQLAQLQILRRLSALREPGRFFGWLLRIVERECRRLFRLQGRAESTQPEALDGLAGRALPLELQHDLSRAIAALPEPYRVVVLLCDVDECTADEAALQLGLSRAAVKSRLLRARQQLRAALGPKEQWLEPLR